MRPVCEWLRFTEIARVLRDDHRNKNFSSYALLIRLTTNIVNDLNQGVLDWNWDGHAVSINWSGDRQHKFVLGDVFASDTRILVSETVVDRN